MMKSIPGSSPTWVILQSLIWVFLAAQLLDWATMLLIPQAAEFNPIVALVGPWAAGVLKIAAGLFAIWASLRMSDLPAVRTLTIGIIIGSIGLGSNISVLLGLWRAGLL